MEKKEPIKISLPVFVTIIILLVAIVYGVFMYTQNEKLENEITNLKDGMSQSQNISETSIHDETTKSNNKNDYSFSEIKGLYIWKYEDKDSVEGYDGEAIALYEDGTYATKDTLVHADEGAYGNYTIDGNTVILNELFYHGSDIGITIQNRKQTKFTIENNSLISKSGDRFIKQSSEGETYETMDLNNILKSDQEAMENEGHYGF